MGSGLGFLGDRNEEDKQKKPRAALLKMLQHFRVW